MPNTTPITIDYSDIQLRVLIEEYLNQQRTPFTLTGVCSYVLYWAIEEGRTTAPQNALFETNQLHSSDCERISRILSKIAQEQRISIESGDKPNLTNAIDQNTFFTKSL